MAQVSPNFIQRIFVPPLSLRSFPTPSHPNQVIGFSGTRVPPSIYLVLNHSWVAMPTSSLQQILAPLILTECLQVRLQDQVTNLTSILDDTPSGHRPVRLAIIDSLVHLEAAIHQLQFTKLVLNLSIQQQLQHHLRAHQCLPAIENVDDPSNSEP